MIRPPSSASTLSLFGLGLAGLVLEAGCLWIWALSPQLTQIYTPEFTREFSARFQVLPPPLVGALNVGSTVLLLEVGLLVMIAGYLLGLAIAGLSHDCHRRGPPFSNRFRSRASVPILVRDVPA